MKPIKGPPYPLFNHIGGRQFARAVESLPSADTLHALLDLSQDGRLFWKPRGPEMFPRKGNDVMWNKQHAGKEAFTVLLPSGYLYGTVLDKMCRARRVVFEMVFGYEPEEVDHIDGCRTNNNPLNLRACSRQLNMLNQGLSSRNKSGVVGVRTALTPGKWIAHISIAGVKTYLGTFDSREAAVAARCNAEVEHGYHPNHGKVRAS